MKNEYCGRSTEDLDCMGCGQKLRCVRVGLHQCPHETDAEFKVRHDAYLAREAERHAECQAEEKR